MCLHQHSSRGGQDHSQPQQQQHKKKEIHTCVYFGIHDGTAAAADEPSAGMPGSIYKRIQLFLYICTHTHKVYRNRIYPLYIEDRSRRKAKAINIFSLFCSHFQSSLAFQTVCNMPASRPPTVYTSWRIPSIFRSIVYPIPVVPFISNRSAILNEIRLSVFPFILLAYVIIAFDWTAEYTISKNLYKIIIGCVYSLQQALLIKRIDFIIFLELFLCLPADA